MVESEEVLSEVPPEIRLIRDFVNTREPQTSAEVLGTPQDLHNWLERRLLVTVHEPSDATDLAAAITVREGFRALLMGHAGHHVDGDAVHGLNQVLADLPVRLVFTETGYSMVSGTDSDFGLALGRLADAIRKATEDGTWPRLKVCARETCRWAFYDASRNQVRRWCSMAGCGNHIKMKRAYAARKNRQRSTADAAAPDRPEGPVVG